MISLEPCPALRVTAVPHPPHQPPETACIRKLTFQLALATPLITHGALQVLALALLAPAGPYSWMWVALSSPGTSPTLWSPLHQGRLKLHRLGSQPEPAGSLCPFEDWDTEH